MSGRIVVIGSPRAGKTTYANARGEREGVQVRHTDDLIEQLSWSDLSQHVALEWIAAPGPWIIEGVAAVRALRKWLRAHDAGRPCDEVVLLEHPHEALTKGQASMARACSTIWAEIDTELLGRGVLLARGSEGQPPSGGGAMTWKTARAKGGYNHHAVRAGDLSSNGRNARAACGFRPSSPTTSSLYMRPRHGWLVRRTSTPLQACKACLSAAPDAWPLAVEILARQAKNDSLAGNRAAAACKLEILLARGAP